jgi:hypothetical protein
MQSRLLPVWLAKRAKAPALAFLLACIPLPLADAQQAQVPTAAEWRADLAFLDTTIRDVHPAPFHRVAEADYAKAVSALDRAIPTLTPRQIAVRIAAIISLLNDGHSRMVLDNPLFPRAQAFPVRIDRFADGIRVVAVTPASRALLGARVIRFGALDATAAWDSLAAIASGDNVFSRWAAVPRAATIPVLLDALGISPAESLALVAVSDKGDTVRMTIAPATASDDHLLFSASWNGPAGATASIAHTGADAPLSERHRRDMYWYVVQGRRLYAQVNAVGNAQDSVHLDGRVAKVSFAEFTDSVLARLDSGGIERMVLDLRYNDGGNNGLVKAMVAGLAARPSINQRGRLFVVTGRTTYSAAMNFTSLLEDRTAALFVGESPGGSPRHYGDATRFGLPNSRLSFQVSTLRWEIGVQPTDVRQVMEPDLSAPPTASALAAGRDVAMEAIDAYPARTTLGERLGAAYKSGGLPGVRAAYSASRDAARAPAPWNADGQQLVRFAYDAFSMAKSRQDVLDILAWITEVAPESADVWLAKGRAHAFMGDQQAARGAYERALALRPQDALIRRLVAVAKRR